MGNFILNYKSLSNKLSFQNQKIDIKFQDESFASSNWI